MSFTVAVVLVLGTTLVGSMPQFKDERIVGGAPATEGQFPHQVSLKVRQQHFCGGSIIAPQWILTAAHCVHRQPASNYEVVVGTNRWNSGGVTHKVAQIIEHPSYNPRKLSNDVALMRLSSPISYNSRVQPIQLATSATQGGDSCVLSGWGLTSYPGTGPVDLQYFQPKSIGIEECKRQLPTEEVSASNVCTYLAVNQGACKGDSGGPLLCNGVQHGVMSWGYPCARGKPDVFANVAFFRSWIRTNSGV